MGSHGGKKQRAKELLSLPGASVTRIACELHYEDAARFTRAVRRWTGTAPARWRRMAHVSAGCP